MIATSTEKAELGSPSLLRRRSLSPAWTRRLSLAATSLILIFGPAMSMRMRVSRRMSVDALRAANSDLRGWLSEFRGAARRALAERADLREGMSAAIEQAGMGAAAELRRASKPARDEARENTSPETDALMDKATVETDGAKRGALYRELVTRVTEASPVIYVHELNFPTIINKQFKDVIDTPLGIYGNYANAQRQ